MPLSELFSTDLWAITPQALEVFLQTLLRVDTPGAGGAQPATPSLAALPSSAGGNDRLAGYSLQDGVAVIDVRGMILRRAGGINIFGMAFSWDGQDGIRSAIADAVADPRAGAILLSFDSPGGIAPGTKELADFISASAEKKPVYAYADGTCCSAAYWLAAATGHVYASASSTLGSIGVLSSHVDRSAMNAANGVRITYITGGTWKAAGNPDTPLSASDQRYLQERVDALHEMFRAGVASCMPVDAEHCEKWGEGQAMLAGKAQEVGLVTGIVTDRDELIARINKEIHMDKSELAAKHPELLAQIQAEARADAQKALASAHEAQLAAVTSNTAALVEAVAGKEAAEKVTKLNASGVTAAQLEAIAPMLAAHAASGKAPEANPESAIRAEILAALRFATPGPISTLEAPKDEVSALAAAVKRISAIGV